MSSLVTSAPVARPWNLVDFFLVVLGGYLGAFVAAAITVAWDDPDLGLLISVAGQYGGHLLVLWLIARDRADSSLGFSITGRDLLYVPLGALTQIVLVLLFAPLAERLLPDADSAQELVDEIASVDSAAILAGVILVTVVVAPAVEELIFRGVLLRALEHRSRATVIILTSLVFAAFHLAGLDPDTFLESAAVVLPQLFIVGAILAWLTLREKRLGPAIMLHSGFNLIAAIAILAAN